MKYGEVPQQKKLENVNNKAGVVILSRYSSSRLPGKALMKIDGKPVLMYIIERLTQILQKKDIIIATSDEPTDDVIEQFALKNGVDCFRGSLSNVSRRFYEAGTSKNWDYAIRVNGDNIFLDIPLLQRVIQLSRDHNYDFISNVYKRTYPKGMSVESVKLDYYRHILSQFEDDNKYSEHVTLYLYEKHKHDNFRFLYNKEEPDAKGVQFALDTPEDYDRTKEIISRFRLPHYNYNLKEIFNLSRKI